MLGPSRRAVLCGLCAARDRQRGTEVLQASLATCAGLLLIVDIGNSETFTGCGIGKYLGFTYQR